MTKGRYSWSDSNIPIIYPHSIAKHEVLGSYLTRYIQVLTSKPHHAHFRLVLVDGFAGGGIYRRSDNNSDHEGSPLIMMRSVQSAVDKINQERTKKLEVEPSFVFIEKDGDAFNSLCRALNEREVPFRQNVTMHHESFSEIIDAVLNTIVNSGKKRAIFLLDQYGFSNVPLDKIRNIFHFLPQAEVLLTFSVDALVDFFITNEDKGVLRKIGIESYSDYNQTPQSQMLWRRGIEAHLSNEIYRKSGALFYTPFFIRSSASARGYWFIHLSNHYRARDEMMLLHWDKHTHFIHHGKSGLNMLAYDSRYDPKVTGQMAFHFDDPARCDSIEKLCEEIPRYISDDVGRNGLTFEDFLYEKFNDTPAHAGMIKQAIDCAMRSNDLLVRGPNGEQRRKGTAITPKDIILPNRQLRLIFD